MVMDATGLDASKSRDLLLKHGSVKKAVERKG
jgi:hypothetical protein